MIYPSWVNFALYISVGLFFLDYIGGGAIFWKVGGMIWVLAIARIGYWYLFQRPKFRVIGTGPVNIPGTAFALQPPVGWTVETATHLSLPACFGGWIGKFRSNIIFELDQSFGTLEESLGRSKVSIQSREYRDISNQHFRIERGAIGIRNICEYTLDLRFRCIPYVFFISDNTKLIVYCTTLASQGEIMDELFDRCVKKMCLN